MPDWKKDRVCAYCTRTFQALASNVKRGRGKFCSFDCSAAALTEANTRHPPLEPGDRFHYLTLVEPIAKGRNPTWLVKCDCGTEKVTRASRFRGKRPLMSCGCYRLPRESNPNAMNKHPLYFIWRGILARTKDLKDPLYGGRGIKVCERWSSGDGVKSGFTCFIDDMGPRPSPKHSIDRYPDKDGHYSPDNCRWATPKEQARNTSKTIFVEVDGQKMCLIDAVPLLNSVVPYECVLSRLDRGWPLADAISLTKIAGVPLRNRLRQPGTR